MNRKIRREASAPMPTRAPIQMPAMAPPLRRDEDFEELEEVAGGWLGSELLVCWPAGVVARISGGTV